MIRVRCPKCAWGFEVEDAMRGRTDRCPRCATPAPVPHEPTAAVVTHRETIVRVPLSDADAEFRPDFDRYLAALAAAVPPLNPFAPTGPGADLTVTVTLLAGGKPDFAAVVRPGGSTPDSLARLLAALFAVRAPATRGPAAEATLVFAVRGGAGT